MKYQFTDEQMEFKRNIDSFLRSALPSELANKVKTGAGVNKQELTNWTRILNKKGWAAPNWPIEHGGTGWNLIQRHIFDSCCRSMHAPALSGFGLKACSGPSYQCTPSSESMRSKRKALQKFQTARARKLHLSRSLYLRTSDRLRLVPLR